MIQKAKVRKALGALVGVLMIASVHVAHADDETIAGLEYSSANRATVKEQILKWSPKAKVVEKEGVISAKSVTIGGELYDVTAEFKTETPESGLSFLAFSTRSKEPSILKGYTKDEKKADHFWNGRLQAIVKTEAGKTKIEIRRPWPLYAAYAFIFTCMAAIYCAFRFVYRRPILTIVVTGATIAWALTLDTFWHWPIMLAWIAGMWFVTKDSVPGAHFADPSEAAFNPANGMPMVGGVDIHGNSYGSNLNDPH